MVCLILLNVMSENSRARGPPLTPDGALNTSDPLILPPGPEPAPAKALRSIPFSSANFFANGLANNLPAIPDGDAGLLMG